MPLEYQQGLRTTKQRPIDWVKGALEKSEFKDELNDLKITTAKKVISDAVEQMKTKSMKQVYTSMGPSLVLSLQLLLNGQGATLSTDALYGSSVRAAVLIFQSNNGLTKDGQAGKGTLTKLLTLVGSPTSSVVSASPVTSTFISANEIIKAVDSGLDIDLSSRRFTRKIEIDSKDYRVVIDKSGTVQFAQTDKSTGKSIKGTGRMMPFNEFITDPGVGEPAVKQNNTLYASDMYISVFGVTGGGGYCAYIIKDKKLITDNQKVDLIIDAYLK